MWWTAAGSVARRRTLGPVLGRLHREYLHSQPADWWIHGGCIVNIRSVFGCFAVLQAAISSRVTCRVLAMDLRGHGEAIKKNNNNILVISCINFASQDIKRKYRPNNIKTKTVTFLDCRWCLSFFWKKLDNVLAIWLFCCRTAEGLMLSPSHI